MSVSILVCTPAISGDMNFQYVLSIIKLERLCRDEGITIDYQFVAHESLIPRARNYLCEIFLSQSSHTHLLFLDADIAFDPEDILRMIRSNVPLIGGVYPKKKLNWERIKGPMAYDDMPSLLDYVVIPLKPSDPVDTDTPCEVKYIGTGMMLIQRHVLLEMAKANPTNTYLANGERYHLYFHCALHENEYLSEDYYFCEVWRMLGGKVYAAYWTKSTHWGLIGYKGATPSNKQ